MPVQFIADSEQILGSVTEKLRLSGCTCIPMGNWCVLANSNIGRSGLFLVTPRRPELKDFYNLSLQHKQLISISAAANTQTSVVHDTPRVPQDHENMLKWLSRVSGRGLDTIETCTV